MTMKSSLIPTHHHLTPPFLVLVGGLEHFSFSISYMGCHPSHGLIFFRGVGQPPTRLLLTINHLLTIIINHHH